MGSSDGIVKIGAVGGGYIGQMAHIANFSHIGQCRVTALAELRPGLGKLVCDRYSIPRLFPDHHEMLANGDLDAVVVATRRAAMGSVVLDCLRAGKHVLSEKPMAGSLGQAKRLVKAANNNDVHYAVGYMKRHDYGVQFAKSQFDMLRASGELGPVLHARQTCYGGNFLAPCEGMLMTDEPQPEGLELWPEAPEWLAEKHHEDYAHFLNVYVHDINILRYMFGLKPAVLSVDFGNDTKRLVHLDFGDFKVVFEAGWMASDDWHEHLEIVFEKGVLSINFPSPMKKNAFAVVEIKADGKVSDKIAPAVSAGWAFRRQAEAFVTDIVEDRIPLASGKDALDDMKVVEDIWRMQSGGLA